jgi:hypothetical protein
MDNLIAVLEHAAKNAAMLEHATEQQLRQIILLIMDLTETAETVSEIRAEEQAEDDVKN